MSSNFMLIIKIFFIVKDCVNNFGLMLGVMISANFVLKKFSNLYDCLFLEGCFKWVYLKCRKV